MTEKDAGQLIDRFLTELVSLLDFKRIESVRYARPAHDAIAILSFPWHLSADGHVTFNVWVALRFESLVEWLDDEPAEMRPTLMRPIHFLREDQTYTTWTFSSRDGLEKLRDSILDDLKRYALPFIDRYSRVTELRKAIESPDKQDWIAAGLNVDTRVTTLAAIQVVEGDKAGATKTLDDALLERKNEHRKRRFDIEYLRKRLQETN